MENLQRRFSTVSTRSLLYLYARPIFVFVAISISIFSAPKTESASSDWIVQSKPAFPSAALAKNAEGVVKLRIIVSKNGSVDHAVIAKSSGSKDLDEAAQRGVLL